MYICRRRGTELGRHVIARDRVRARATTSRRAAYRTREDGTVYALASRVTASSSRRERSDSSIGRPEFARI